MDLDSEFIQVRDSQGVELEIGDKVLVSLGKYFAKRIVADFRLGRSHPRWDGTVYTGPSEVLIQEEGNNTKRWTYAYRVVKYDWI